MRLSLESPSPQIRVDSDVTRVGSQAQLPKITLLQRAVVGKTADGERVFDWVVLASDLTVVTYEQREVIVADVRRLQLELTAVWEDETVLDATDLAFRMESVAGEDHLYRINQYEQNGFRLELKAERAL